MKRWLVPFAAGVLSAVAVAAATGVAIVSTGAVDVAATEAHSDAVYQVLESARENAIARRAAEVVPPANFTELDLAAGANSYKAMCQQCHGGPGVEAAVWAADMNPRPPSMSVIGQKRSPEEIYWVLKHGIKMTGMPAIGPSHSEETLWETVAFVKQLPRMSAEQYDRGYGPAADERQLADDGHDHVH